MSYDKVKANASFAARQRFPFRLLSDTGREAGVLYGASEDHRASSANRVSFLIGPDGVILKAYLKVKAAEHPREVLEDLRAVVAASKAGGSTNVA